MRIAIVFIIVQAALRAQNAFPTPTPQLQFLNSGGQPLAAGKLCTYVSNTTTPLATYTDSTAITANSNPIILDSSGSASIWINPSALYTYVLRSGGDGTCATGSILWTQNNVGLQGPGLVNAIYLSAYGSGASGTGAYIDLAPVRYPVQNCYDAFGNSTNVPIRYGSFPNFGTDDTIMWVSQSPLAGVNPAGCVNQLATQTQYGHRG